MTDEMPDKTEIESLEYVFQQILIISKGECQINDGLLSKIADERYFNILSGLQMLHEDLDLYKEEFKKKMEAEFQLEVLKKRNEELAQFNYVASHDLQEPLRTIHSFTDLLLRHNYEHLDHQGQRYLKYIKESSSRMSELITGLLNYSRVGKNIALEPVDCTEIIKEILHDLNHAIQKTSPIIIVSNLPTVTGDKIRLRQVFQNLISNALKFKSENKSISLNISATTNNNDYIFCFEDNGIGIEETYFKKIFGIFQRLHVKSEYEGMGIGLALSKKIIEMHNGKVWVESQIGIGSKFFISLPKDVQE